MLQSLVSLPVSFYGSEQEEAYWWVFNGKQSKLVFPNMQAAQVDFGNYLCDILQCPKNSVEVFARLNPFTYFREGREI